jgi:glutathione S-transferase
MSSLTFYTHPMSRGQTIRWMLEEVGEPYETEILDYGSTMKAEPYLSINPMGKVPAIKHGDKVVTEVAAICCYLADAFPHAGLAPPPADRADYYRWIFFTSGPVEAAFSNKAAGWEPTPERQRMFGYGTYDLAIATLEKALTGRDYIAADFFTAADLFVGANINFMLAFSCSSPGPCSPTMRRG